MFAGVPLSTSFKVQQTPNAGRAVFATRRIASATVLLRTDNLSASVIFRDYRKEVCAQCFAYDRGVEWKIRHPAGLVFCTEACRDVWRRSTDACAVAFHDAVELFMRRRNRGDDDGEDYNSIARPEQALIDKLWAAAEADGDLIAQARHAAKPNKVQARALRTALDTPPAPDTLTFLLSGVLCHARLQGDWDSVLQLHSYSQPYFTRLDLDRHITSYKHLLALAPLSLLAHVSPTVLRTTAARAAQNSFSIRSTDDAGSEIMGYGVWPTASYFNHSCAPNLGKKRVGRQWVFYAVREVQAGEELSISYLGGDEDDLDTMQRRQKLKDSWGFDCACLRCGQSSA